MTIDKRWADFAAMWGDTPENKLAFYSGAGDAAMLIGCRETNPADVVMKSNVVLNQFLADLEGRH